MISLASLISMGVTAVLCLLLPAIVFIFFKKKEGIGFKPVLTGMVVFFVFAQILEQMLHAAVIGSNLILNPILFSVYGALAAGVFEETGRFIAFKTILKNNHDWKDGIAYGIGHGGIEAVLIGVTILGIGIMMKNGAFDTALGQHVSAQTKELLLQSAANSSLLDITERIFAFGMHMALSMIVLYAVKYRKNIYFFIAILLHALIDFPAGLYQAKIISNMYVVECMLLALFTAALIFVSNTKKIFNKEAVYLKS